MAESKVLTTNHSRSYSHGWNNNTMAILMAGQVVIAEEIQAVCFFLHSLATMAVRPTAGRDGMDLNEWTDGRTAGVEC